jgi:chromosome segregation ATPase
MDQNNSSTSGADVTLPGSGSPYFLQVARSSQPNPVTQLLQQISTLRDELNHERQQHATEHEETRDKYEADLQLLRDVKGNLEKNLEHMQEKYKEELTGTLKKVEYLEGDWTALQTRVAELRSEVDTLGVAAAVRPSLSLVPLQREDTVDKVDERSGSKVLSDWQLEKTELLHRHKALEEKLINQRSESAQVLQETRDGLGSIIVEFNEITKKLVDRKAALEAVQACQEVRSSLNWI